MLALYERHYGPYPGSFERSMAQQEHLLRFRLQHNPPMLAVDPEGRPHGYLIHPWSPEETYTTEVAADDWPALLALLVHAAHHRPSPSDRRDAVLWPLPPDSPMFYRLADRLPVRSQTHFHPNEGWMARPGHLPTLFQAMLPEWQARWQGSGRDWIGTLALTVGDEAYRLELGPDGVRLRDHRRDMANAVTLCPQVFAQLLLGYRPVRWAAEQPGQQVSEDLLPLLDVLFPTAPAWIAGSDAF
jgi:hypothetical protein